MPFQFELMAQTVERKEPKQEGVREQQEKIERFSVLDGIRKYAADHVLLSSQAAESHWFQRRECRYA
ncbi:hypothetical protein [Thermocoleostomius sinensis]|uniref:Uncharacterized protein n=1 Tax=Thermocoleostomius sinensis A174 TaxID=2016057 RepID=A0A9E8Z8Z9_9CYAN|nr:hypothetical protein [Thermocoleostomius sinensis]WAL58723.1 hypothetical protein OXH18_16265 [Thermocoleostomius sinensis A174]